SSEYLDDLLNLRNTNRTIYSELPLNKEIVERFILATSGTILACKLALDNQYAINLSGGFHHAFPDHAEGFCYINDVAVTCAKLINERLVSKILIVDLDLHQGNGTAVAFKNDSRVFTFSMHQDSCYPKKEMSDCDIGLADFTDDITYLTILKSALDKLFIKEKPEFIFYLAGADPYYKDQLGSLKLTFDGLMKRDNLVIEKCLLNNIPLAIVVAGGYAENPNDTVQIHYNTCLVLKECERKYL
ncbi:MAG: histone deacetylase, partial [Spirochaetota bacterium]|nr:histone deacetylase [Spirochaetota bacterium]